MNTRYLYLSSTVAALTLVLMNGSLGVPTVWATAQALDISKIEQLTGVKGKLNDKEGVWDSPKVMFMHIGGSGSEEKLAAAVGKIFARDKETSDGKAHAPYIELDPAKTSLDPKKIGDFLGVKGEMTDSVYKVTLGRTTKMGEHVIGNAMGVNTWAAFVGSNEKAIVDGDFAMYEDELQSVLKALRAAGINIVAIHSHMSMESPKVAFLHY